ncbi:hypothetical protein [Sporichthya polymorpha]|uniref:hypothetical protein n=1 Tax=Sporichthya polymorpha TaxID=35751 RepID=UPI00037A8C10|nr:hypothetical protein [Sporichthya polymorpha]
MRLFRKKAATGDSRRADLADRDHLKEWSETRVGVEAYLEPQTAVTEPTVMLIAHDGEWTRRRVPSHEHARSLMGKLGIPVYDVALTGYPQRKRDYDARRAAERKQGR